MKNLSIYLFFAFVVATMQAQAQPYAIGKTTRNYIDANRSNRSINTEIYYPATTTGTNTPPAAGSFGIVCVGHGFVMGIDAYYHLKDSLVPMGYVVALVNMEGGIQPSHSNFGIDIAQVAQNLGDENTQATSIFNNHLNGKKAVLGHSMGGGAGLLATANNPNIHAYIGLAPAETTPSAIAAAANTTCPVLIFAGTNDCVTPPTTHQIPMYNATKNTSTCATYIEISGASHCKFANSNAACNFGEANCPGTITRPIQHQILFKYLVPFLDFTLKSNATSLTQFKNMLTNDTNINYQQQCNNVSTNNNTTQQQNIALNIQTIATNNYQITTTEPLTLTIYDIWGKKIMQDNTPKTTWNIQKNNENSNNTLWLLYFKNKNNDTQTLKIR
jgi:dienelactone hydrolase